MTAVDHAELKRVAEGAISSLNSGLTVKQIEAAAVAFDVAANPAVVLELLSEIEGLKAERDAAMTLDKGFYEWMVERDLLARGEEVDWSDIVVALTEHEIECCPDPLRTQAPDSWRPDREAIKSALGCIRPRMVTGWRGEMVMGLGMEGLDQATDRILALTKTSTTDDSEPLQSQ